MHLLRSPLLSLTCLGLLASQVSGLHMHVDSEGYVGAPHPTHVHATDLPASEAQHGSYADVRHVHDHPSDPDHDGERDISIFELSAGVSKVLIFFAWFCLTLLVIPRRDGRIPLLATAPRAKTRQERWRPPLRAPPLPSPR